MRRKESETFEKWDFHYLQKVAERSKKDTAHHYVSLDKNKPNIVLIIKKKTRNPVKPIKKFQVVVQYPKTPPQKSIGSKKVHQDSVYFLSCCGREVRNFKVNNI
jgi:hypothetical protein